MFITAIDLDTAELSKEHTFYTQTLGLPLLQATTNSFTVQAGTTALTFRSSNWQPLLYHFAFTIPSNKWKQAKTWLTARTTLLEGEGEDEFDSPRVRTHSYYFPDPASNILEFIVRDDLPARDGEDFAQLGDINGVLVPVKRGRLWFPDRRQPAVVPPVRVAMLGTLAQQITLEPYPYTVEIVPLSNLWSHV